MKQARVEDALDVFGVFWIGRAAAWAGDGQPYKFMLADQSVISGALVGLDHGTLTVRADSGDTADVAVGDIKRIFDQDGKSVPVASLKDLVPAQANGDDGDQAVQPKEPSTAAAARVRLKRVHGDSSRILIATGLAIGAAGAILAGYAYNQEQSGVDVQHAQATDNGFFTYPVGLGMAATGVGLVVAGIFVRATDPYETRAWSMSRKAGLTWASP